MDATFNLDSTTNVKKVHPSFSKWPSTEMEDWCGEHEPRRAHRAKLDEFMDGPEWSSEERRAMLSRESAPFKINRIKPATQPGSPDEPQGSPQQQDPSAPKR